MANEGGLGFVSLPDKGANDRFLADLVARLQAQGVRVTGLVQANVERADRPWCDMEITVLPDGPRLRINDDRGALAKGCRLNHGALEEAVFALMQRLGGAEVLVINKFGKQEGEGKGCVPALVAALDQGLPVVIGVNALNLPAFQAFAGDLAQALPTEPAAALQWCLTHRSATV